DAESLHPLYDVAVFSVCQQSCPLEGCGSQTVLVSLAAILPHIRIRSHLRQCERCTTKVVAHQRRGQAMVQRALQAPHGLGLLIFFTDGSLTESGKRGARVGAGAVKMSRTRKDCIKAALFP
ncbi:hypothetical protein FOZ62_002485, partial [Perkinsus olseni]